MSNYNLEDPYDSLNKITEQIYLGDLFAAETEGTLKDKGITHIVSIGEDPEIKFEGVNYYFFQAMDVHSEIISWHFEKTNEVI